MEGRGGRTCNYMAHSKVGMRGFGNQMTGGLQSQQDQIGRAEGARELPDDPKADGDLPRA